MQNLVDHATLDNTLVDTIVDETNEQLKLVAEMPGVEKYVVVGMEVLERMWSIKMIGFTKKLCICLKKVAADVICHKGLLQDNGIEFEHDTLLMHLHD